ncbi:unnamed protein product [Cyclocybe aegerita]|uniref:Protein kinase domain-containing protein n=1 Tax=Cyclocybe aegerita TaxID=1973307 RepID=A0A8S0WMW4_CYCAE|nr:unnamed protein product [Cyclocybe aegerita]
MASTGSAEKVVTKPATPSKSKVAKENPRRAEAARKILKLELDGHLYQDITVEQFVINVWGLDEATVRRIMNTDIDLHKRYWKKYEAVCNKPSQSQPEQHLHEPFRHISSHLLKNVCKKLGLDWKETIKDTFWDGGGSKNMKSRYAYGRLRKPDLLRIWGLRDGRKRPRWSETKSAVEFKLDEAKRGSKKNANGGYTNTLQSIQEGAEIAGIATPQSGDALPTSSSFASSSRDTGSGSRIQSFSTPLTSYADLSVSTTFNSSMSGKRLFNEVDGGDGDDDGNPPKRAKVAAVDGDEEEEDEDEANKPEIEVKNGEIQLATYALECLGDSSRHYTTGIFIDSTSVNLWYYDRSAVIRASKFQFNTEENNHGTKLLAVALFALSQATMKQSGFDPFVHRFIEPKNGVVLQEHHIKAITIPLSIRSKTCFRFSKNGEDLIFVVDKVLYTYSSIIGRGTYVASGKRASIGSALGEISNVLKLSWQLQVRHAEAELLRRIRGRLPDYWHRHLPAVRFSAVYKPEELGLPRSKLKEVLKARKEIQERDLHVLVTDLYHKLHEAADVEEFKRIFLDCLEPLSHLHDRPGVASDISENNLMFADPKEVTAPSGATDQPSSRWGILNDFDLGSEIDEVGNVQPSNANHRTGTLPYMATDLLSQPVPRNPHVQYVPPSHYYRHDLESFFYILVFASTRYTFDKGKCLPVPACLAAWSNSDTAYDKKCVFFTPSGLQHVNAAILDHFKGLWDEWIIPLYAMFMKARNDVPGTWEPEYKEYDFVTLNNRITFEKFMAAIKVKPRNSDGKRPL